MKLIAQSLGVEMISIEVDGANIKTIIMGRPQQKLLLIFKSHCILTDADVFERGQRLSLDDFVDGIIITLITLITPKLSYHTNYHTITRVAATHI